MLDLKGHLLYNWDVDKSRFVTDGSGINHMGAKRLKCRPSGQPLILKGVALLNFKERFYEKSCLNYGK